MKHIIICGGDRLGKNSLIEGLTKYFNYDNVCVRHFGKPSKTLNEGESPLSFQINCFEKEGAFLNFVSQLEEDTYNYYENVVIWNRSHYGEYVYGQMFRNQPPIELENYIKNFDEEYLLTNSETYLVLLTATPEFFLSQEDGNSFSKNIAEKTKEIMLFDEIFKKSLIDKKIRIKVNVENNFVTKEKILKKVLNFIKTNN
jgi:hypothetical protein